MPCRVPVTRQSLHDYLPAESGRDDRHQAAGATIWPTNSLKKTGNYLVPEVVPHTENFYALPSCVPRVVAFSCEAAPWLGGETGLFDGAAALADLPPALRPRLSMPSLVLRVLSLARLRARHGIADVEAFERRCATEQQADDDDSDDVRIHRLDDAAPGFVALQMSRTLAAPTPPPPLGACAALTMTLNLNFGELAHLPGAREALLRGLLARGLFSGRGWRVHRALWTQAFRRPATIGRLLVLLDALPCWLARPRSMLRAWWHARGTAAAEKAAQAKAQAAFARAATRTTEASPPGRQPRGKGGSGRRRPRTPPLPAQAERLADRLTDREAEALAAALAQNMTAFAWQRGDLLLLDNARVLHDGLPGFGPRRLHVALLRQV